LNLLLPSIFITLTDPPAPPTHTHTSSPHTHLPAPAPGLVIHEFDPWFNYRATVYLRDHGVEAFFKWYDHKVWYPLGRPVGTTIYPGMQLTSVAIWNALGADDAVMSLNDVCCYVPAWFGVLATAFLGMLAYECTGSADVGAVASVLMAVVPAHIMRSVGGGYDNESIAMTAMCATFYFWARSLRGNAAAAEKLRAFDADAANPDKKLKKGGMAAAARERARLLDDCNDSGSWVFGAVTGVAYIYMVAAWGGYIFVLNMIAFHAVALVAMGRYTPKLHKAYTLFYVIGTYGAIQVPVVGLTPLKSMEQLGALGVFGIIQVRSVVHNVGGVLCVCACLFFCWGWAAQLSGPMSTCPPARPPARPSARPPSVF
jgi:dolichyl-diphosphooligosaccharide--protein glycosyltransferase